MPDSYLNGSFPIQGNQPLYLSIDASISTYRATILNSSLQVIWVEQVEIDDELPQFSTRDGVHRIGDSVTYPSSLRIMAFDLLLEKLTHNTQPFSLIPQIVSISGSTPNATLQYLSQSFEPLLNSLSYQWGTRISSVLDPSQTFSTEQVSTEFDSSTIEQIRKLNKHFGTSLSTSSLSSEGIESKRSPRELEELGQKWVCEKTGGKVLGESAVGQLIKRREADERDVEMGEVAVGEGVLGRTERVVLESQLLSSLFVGSLVKMDASDACSTRLFNPQTREWEQEILDYVMGSIDDDDSYKRVKGGKRLREMLGEVESDGAKPVGTVSNYMSKRFGFSPDCLVVPFTGSSPAIFLSYPLSQSPTPSSSTSQREVILSLSTSSTDSLLVPCHSFAPSPQHQVFLNPITGEYCEYVAMMSSKDAGLGRSLVKDMYCNGSWEVFGRLSAIVPHGGTLGLDNKHFSFFFPHGRGSIIQGFLRLVSGGRVPEFSDRKLNPRLLIESQFLSLRIKLSQFYQSLPLSAPSTVVGKYDILGFDKFEKELVPTRIVVVGEMSQNPAVSSILSTVLGAPAYLLENTGARRNRVEGEEVIESGKGGGKTREKLKTSAASLGSGYKAGWSYYKNRGGEKGYNEWLKSMLEAQNEHDQPDDPFEIENSQCPISSSSTLPPHSIPSAPQQHKRIDSGYTTVSSRHSLEGNHSRKSSSATSSSTFTSSTPPSLPSTAHHHKTKLINGRKQQHAYNPDYDEIELGGGVKELGEDPNGLELIAIPDQDEFKYYSSMLPEFVRLQKHASKGLI